MQIRYNKNFESLTESNFSFSSIPYCTASEYVLNESIVEIDDCYYFKKYAPKSSTHNKNMLVDRTGNECFYNKLFLDDLLDGEATPMKKFMCGLSVVKDLYEKLKSQFSSLPFTIVLSYNYEDCYVRFHKSRDGEHWLADNLDEYLSEAIVEIKW